MLLGEIIYDYRKRNGLTMKEFSDKSGLTKGYISMLEKNYNPRSKSGITPSIATFKKAAKGMNMDFDKLISMVDNQPVTFSAESDDTHENKIDGTERALLHNYRSLDEPRKKTLFDYSTFLTYQKQAEDRSKAQTPAPDADLKAAHYRDDIDVTDEMKKHDDDIMNDDNF
jgi:transcriptional regulator with XRE-family HTH domain